MISFVIPTRNEPDIEKLIQKIKDVMKDDRPYEIIVIDYSEDDTFKRAIKAGAKAFSQESVGLGGALMEGMLKAAGEVGFTMDADLSHDPRFIPRFIEKINSGFDVVIGSRKLEGGRVQGWGLKRKLISGGANFVGRYVAGVNVSDLTSGYRAYRLNAVKSLDPDVITAKGFSFQLEILYHLLRKGFSVTTVPITFLDRRRGKSKLTKREVREFLGTAFKLLWFRIKETLRS